VRHSPAFGPLTLERGSDAWRPEHMNFVCVDLQTGEFSTLPGSIAQGRDIFIARENGNHFLPLAVSHTRREELIPWNSGSPMGNFEVGELSDDSDDHSEESRGERWRSDYSRVPHNSAQSEAWNGEVL